MTKNAKKFLQKSDVEVDKIVKIQGTPFDRKRKLSEATLKKMNHLYKKGKSFADIASKFGCSLTTVKYNLDPEFKAYHNSHRDGKHTGIDVMTFSNRVKYKRDLVRRGKIKIEYAS